MDKNRQAYSLKKVVAHYRQYSVLQNPEAAILKILKPKLSAMKMLDIGVGAGRTTPFFVPLMKEYAAMDFSEEMLNACKNNFLHFSNVQFIQGDMRTELQNFSANSFDFILCSFNSLDYVTDSERGEVLKQIRRICRHHGFFAFSSHNIQCINDFTKIKFRFNLYQFFRKLMKHRRFLQNNKEQFKAAQDDDHIIIFDDVYDFGLNIYYVRPTYQIKLLNEIGFKNVRVFDLKNGNELKTEKEILENKDYWLYYLCSSLHQ